MTNEEIEQKARAFLFQDCPYLEGTGPEGEAAAAAMLAVYSRELVAQAYEEAASVAEVDDTGKDEQEPSWYAGRDRAAREIRALKDQLVEK